MDTVKRLRSNGITVDLHSVGEIAHSFGVREISVFGSALRDDFRPDSDIDLLVTFEQFDQDKMRRLAAERRLPVLG